MSVNETVIKGELRLIENEVIRACRLHSKMNSHHEAYSVILEELDEYWDEVKVNPRKLTETQMHERENNILTELRQIAAMCIRAIHDLA